jgi:serine/threonine protein kinase
MAGDVVEDVISAPNKDIRLPNEGMMSTSEKDLGLSNQGLMSMSNEGLMGDAKRFRLEDFSLLTTIGTGTFARVCLCQEEHTRDYYALKVMAKHDLVRQKQVAHVKSEKSILEQVNHPFLLELLWSHQGGQLPGSYDAVLLRRDCLSS